ncbi:UDP-GlcNAc:undecaprenyl-phosphate GlcNAc-1-phosphate transferase [Microbacteriaceae bacterium MWH-Ta3]|nr:UDP-GlcNAc:undecaprenyl-phosphate GlcNAc-1-phosphate transferase [Microbacteriaceae bacterium MWH-Ta3]
MLLYILVGLVAAAVSFLASRYLLKLAHKYRIYPGIRERDVHSTPTPRLGGIAIVLGLGVGITVASLIPKFAPVFVDPMPVIGLAIAVLLMTVIGVLDDLYDLDWLLKLGAQLLSAGILAWFGIQIVSLPFDQILLLSPGMSLVITVIGVVLVMNAINFIDGLDGLVAGVTLIAGAVFFIYSYLLATGPGHTLYFNFASLLTAVLCGSIIGFLPVNWYPAKMFMGDSGALVIGLVMAASSISVTGQVDPAEIMPGQLVPAFIPLALPLAVLIIPLVDFVWAVTRRVTAGRSPFAADRKHLHHRLLDLGHTHFQAVLILYAWTLVVAVGVLLFMFVPASTAIIVLVLGLIVTTILTILPLRNRSVLSAKDAS